MSRHDQFLVWFWDMRGTYPSSSQTRHGPEALRGRVHSALEWPSSPCTTVNGDILIKWKGSYAVEASSHLAWLKLLARAVKALVRSRQTRNQVLAEWLSDNKVSYTQGPMMYDDNLPWPHRRQEPPPAPPSPWASPP